MTKSSPGKPGDLSSRPRTHGFRKNPSETVCVYNPGYRDVETSGLLGLPGKSVHPAGERLCHLETLSQRPK